MNISEDILKTYSNDLEEKEKTRYKSTIQFFISLLEKYGFHLLETIEKENGCYSYVFYETISGRKYTLLIEGSYGNGTCISGSGDLDISLIYEPNIDDDLNNCNQSLEFRKSLLSYLNSVNQNKYQIIEKNKSIVLNIDDKNYKNIDIIPAVRYRSANDDQKTQSIMIMCKNGEKVIHYPERSIDNCYQKDQLTNSKFKKVIKVIKKLKNIIIDEQKIDIPHINSYGIECMLYNVPNSNYIQDNNLKSTVATVLNYLVSNRNDYLQYKETNDIKLIFNNTYNIPESYYRLFVSLLALSY